MNREWMRERLESFKALCETYQPLREDRPRNEGELEELRGRMATDLPTVREIIKRIAPELLHKVEMPRASVGAINSLRAMQEAIGIVRDQDAWAENLAPDGPSLIADQFHPHVWAAAAALWDTGQYRVAVGQAAVSLSAHIAKKAGSTMSERELVAQVFSPNEAGSAQVRLHLPGDKSDKTWRSRQEGLHLVAQGAFAGIRNVAIHTDDEWSEQIALEHLAILSVVARWADETKVITGP